MKLEIKNDQNDQNGQKDNETIGYKPSKKVVDLLIDYALIGLSDKKLYYEIADFYKDKGYPHMCSMSKMLTNHLGEAFDDIKCHIDIFDIVITCDSEKTNEKYESEMDAFEIMYDLEKDRLSALNDIMLTISEEKDFIHMDLVQTIVKKQLSVYRHMQNAYKIMKRDGNLDLKGRDIIESVRF